MWGAEDWGAATWAAITSTEVAPLSPPLPGPIVGQLRCTVTASTPLSCSLAPSATLTGVVVDAFAMPAVCFTRS